MLRRDDVVLVVIDLQDGLLPKISGGDDVVEKAAKLIRFARTLDLPVVWTEQYPKGLGVTNERVARELGGLKALEKVSFGCFDGPGFEDALVATGRNQLLVTGIETHVCVMQTALVALSKGYEVYVPRDAVGSRYSSDYEAGLARMQAHGGEIVTAEMAMFEVLGAAGTPEFKKVLPLLK